MEKINFINNQAPALNATNLNQMQDNIENAINGVVESGSNENGDWVKYMDGTMICTKRVSGTTSATRSWGPLYEGEVNCGIYPKTFIDTPKITAVSKLGRENIIECFGSSTNNSTFGSLYFLTKDSNQSCNYSFDLIAIGKWK